MKIMHRSREIHNSSLFINGGDGDAIYSIAKLDGGLCIDGGAAAGTVTKLLLESEKVRMIAFEPFPGNHAYYTSNVGDCARAKFYPVALGAVNGVGRFYVSRVVDGNQQGWNHMLGYSSEGSLTQDINPHKRGVTIDVNVVRLEDYIEDTVTLLKLDLQGGEYDALLGLGQKLSMVRYCYIEFSLDWRIVDYFIGNNFIVFDTRYTGVPKVPIELLSDRFDEMKIINLSNGHQAVSGIVKGLPRDIHRYREFIEGFKKEYFHHLWSDLIAVNPMYLRDFFCSAL
jgi:FkbM family methyltransferase